MRKLRLKQDEGLLLALKNGNQEAFSIIYSKYRYALLLKFRKGFKSEDIAQDSLQELFLRVWRAHSLIDPSQSFLSYLYKIAENIIVDFSRSAARDRRMRSVMTAETSEHYSHIEEGMVAREKRYLVNQVIDQLPVKQKKVFRLFKLEGKSYKEISGQLGISLSTINKQVYVANKYVKNRILSKSDVFISFILTIILPDFI